MNGKEIIENYNSQGRTPLEQFVTLEEMIDAELEKARDTELQQAAMDTLVGYGIRSMNYNESMLLQMFQARHLLFVDGSGTIRRTARAIT